MYFTLRYLMYFTLMYFTLMYLTIQNVAARLQTGFWYNYTRTQLVIYRQGKGLIKVSEGTQIEKQVIIWVGHKPEKKFCLLVCFWDLNPTYPVGSGWVITYIKQKWKFTVVCGTS